MKDIGYLAHEPLLQKFRDMKIFLRKYKRLLGRREEDLAKDLKTRMPTFDVDHLVKERYPTVTHAIRDYDDALCQLFVFRALKTKIDPSYTAKVSAMVDRLCGEWHNYVIKTHTLRKAFISIKGIYLQADIRGNPVTWLVPHLTTQHAAFDVDLQIMSTFLHFYQTFARFLNFKLYKDDGLEYPPKLDYADMERALEIFGRTASAAAAKGDEKAVTSSSLSSNKTKGKGKDKDAAKVEPVASSRSAKISQTASKIAAKTSKQAKEEDEADQPAGGADKDGEDLETFKKLDPAALNLNDDSAKAASIFKDCVFLVGREVPYEIMDVIIRSGGGLCVREHAITPEQVTSAVFTHQIVDRPKLAQFLPSRQYVQPQWVVDSLNMGKMLPTAPYGVGAKLPPHLSPFVNDELVGYVPEQANQLRAWVGLPALTTADIKKKAMSQEMQEKLQEEAEESEYRKGLRKEARATLKKESRKIKQQEAKEAASKKARFDPKTTKGAENDDDEEEEEEDDDDEVDEGVEIEDDGENEGGEDDDEEEEEVIIEGESDDDEEEEEGDDSDVDFNLGGEDAEAADDNDDGEDDDEEEVEEEETKTPAVPRPNEYNRRDNERELAKMMMRNRPARLLNRMERNERIKSQKAAVLETKRKALEKGDQNPKLPFVEKRKRR